MPANANLNSSRIGSGLLPGQIIARFQSVAPVNVVQLAERFGLTVWESSTLHEGISGKIFKDFKNGGLTGFSIAVNSREDRARKRFTIVHEIGHFILHRRQLESGELADDAVYRSGLGDKEETEANQLAANILMPHSLIQSLISSGVDDIESLAARLLVPLAAMRVRMGIPQY